jgi:hypothetical protein
VPDVWGLDDEWILVFPYELDERGFPTPYAEDGAVGLMWTRAGIDRGMDR